MEYSGGKSYKSRRNGCRGSIHPLGFSPDPPRSETKSAPLQD